MPKSRLNLLCSFDKNTVACALFKLILTYFWQEAGQGHNTVDQSQNLT